MVVAQVSSPEVADAGARFLAEVGAKTAGVSRLEMCIQCGSCGGSCPSADSMDHTPRKLFALMRAGERDQVLRSNTPWMCLSCYHCVVRCPQDIAITDVMYAVKTIAEHEHKYPNNVGPDFGKVFIGQAKSFGRSYELGLTVRHYLRHFPLRLPGMTPMAFGLFRHGRIGILPTRIKQRKQLQAILRRADELERAR
jgi:NAD-dependent dihydropyrimidine dehydrogenase PreA subunit